MHLRFEVRGSSGSIYDVSASRRGDSLRITCTCAAGQKRQSCKHRFALLDGVIDDLISDNANDLHALKQMLAGSDVERRLGRLRELTDREAALKRLVAEERKALAREMHR